MQTSCLPVALTVESPQKIRGDLYLVAAQSVGHRSLLLDDLMHGVTCDPKTARDFPLFHPFLVQHEYRLTLIHIDHGITLQPKIGSPSTETVKSRSGRGLTGMQHGMHVIGVRTYYSRSTLEFISS